MTLDAEDWRELTRAASFESHRLIGWIYWDPRAIENYAALGVPNGFGYYIASRAAMLAPAGNDVVTAAFYSIHPAFISVCLDECRKHTTFDAVADARDRAVVEGLREYAPEICDELAGSAPALWAAADALPLGARPLFAAERARPRPSDPLISAWLAINCIREWRGDTHWALHVAHDIGPIEAGVLDGAWRAYEADWLPRSRGADDAALSAAYDSLERRGWASDGSVNAAGIAFRQELEDRLDDLASLAWRTFGAEPTRSLVSLVGSVSDRFVERIDATAGPNWMPAARHHPRSRRT
ncbi:MAG: hypothetical protein R2705_25005 [Ilumatobacteraceae bacterium]